MSVYGNIIPTTILHVYKFILNILTGEPLLQCCVLIPHVVKGVLKYNFSKSEEVYQKKINV